MFDDALKKILRESKRFHRSRNGVLDLVLDGLVTVVDEAGRSRRLAQGLIDIARKNIARHSMALTSPNPRRLWSFAFRECEPEWQRKPFEEKVVVYKGGAKEWTRVSSSLCRSTDGAAQLWNSSPTSSLSFSFFSYSGPSHQSFIRVSNHFHHHAKQNKYTSKPATTCTTTSSLISFRLTISTISSSLTL